MLWFLYVTASRNTTVIMVKNYVICLFQLHILRFFLNDWIIPSSNAPCHPGLVKQFLIAFLVLFGLAVTSCSCCNYIYMSVMNKQMTRVHVAVTAVPNLATATSCNISL